MGSAAGVQSLLVDAGEEAFDGAVVEQWWGCYGRQVQVDLDRVALGRPDPVVANLESLFVGAGGKLVDHVAGDRPAASGQRRKEGFDGDPAALVEMNADGIGAVAQHVRQEPTPRNDVGPHGCRNWSRIWRTRA